jgi:hypothetical protein
MFTKDESDRLMEYHKDKLNFRIGISIRQQILNLISKRTGQIHQY